MKNLLVFVACMGILFACSKEKLTTQNTTQYFQESYMGRPGTTIIYLSDSVQLAAHNLSTIFADSVAIRLKTLNPYYHVNFLDQDSTGFVNFLVKDGLYVSLNTPTTYFDGAYVFTGRMLSDDTMDTELGLLFGGPALKDSINLISDHVDSNDHSFLATFPYLAPAN